MDIPIFIIVMIALGILSFFFIFYLIINNQKYLERLLGISAFIFLILFVISVGQYIGKLTFSGTPLSFKELSNSSKYKLMKIIDNNHIIVKIVTNDNESKIEPLFVGDAPKEIMSMKEGEIFELKNIPSIISGRRIIAPLTPMLHPQ